MTDCPSSSWSGEDGRSIHVARGSGGSFDGLVLHAFEVDGDRVQVRTTMWRLEVYLLASLLRCAVAAACQVQSDDGNVALTVGSNGAILSVRGIHRMALKISSVSMEVRAVASDQRGEISKPLEVTRTIVASTQKGCSVKKVYAGNIIQMESFAPTASSVRATTTISSTSKKRIQIEANTNIRFHSWNDTEMSWWTSYDRPLDGVWKDNPLAPTPGALPETPVEYEYGGWKFMTLEPRPGNIRNNSFALPLMSWIQKDLEAGISFVGDPTDSTTFMTMVVDGGKEIGGGFSWKRRFLSVGGNASSLVFSNNWISHGDCWRPALGYFFSSYPEFALPDKRIAQGGKTMVEGAGAYAYFFGQGTQDTEYYGAMDLSFNWDASFPWL